MELSDFSEATTSITEERIRKAVTTSASGEQLTTFGEPTWVVRRLGSLAQGRGLERHAAAANPYILQWAFNVLKMVPHLPEPTRISPQMDGGIQIEWTGLHRAALVLQFRPRHELMIDVEQGEGPRLRKNLTTNLFFLTRVSRWFAGNLAGKTTIPLIASDPGDENPQDAGTLVNRSAKMIRDAAGRAGMTIDRDVQTRSGSRAISFISGRRLASLECDQDGDIVGTLSDRSVDEEAETWVVDPQQISESLDRIQTFLRGTGEQIRRR